MSAKRNDKRSAPPARPKLRTLLRSRKHDATSSERSVYDRRAEKGDPMFLVIRR